MNKLYFIEGNVPSSKNSKRWTGKRLISSANTFKYKKSSKDHFLSIKEMLLNELKELEKPYFIGFHLVRKTKHKYDFINPLQTIQDIMVELELLDDDNVSVMYPLPLKVNGKFTTYDKENPGVYIKIITDYDNAFNNNITD